MILKTKKDIVWGCLLVGTLLCIYMLYFRRAELSEIQRLILIFLPVLGLVVGNRMEKRYKNSNSK